MGVIEVSVIRCPWCGSPVKVLGNRWECGWCGDCGNLPSLSPSERAKIRLDNVSNLSLDGLERGVLSILNGIQEHFGNEEDAKLLAFRLAIYGMSHALLPPGNRTQDNLQLLQAFFQSYAFCTAGEVWATACNGKPAFEEQFLLTKACIGSFWETLLPNLPRYEAYRPWPNWLFQAVDGLSQVESFFSGQDDSDLFDAFQEALNAHWSIYPILHPDRAALEDAIRRWDFSENEWICRDLLIAAFPEAASHWTAEELLQIDTADLLLETSEREPETAIQMMKLLLDTAESHLQEPEAAELLLGNDLYDLCQSQRVQPCLLRQLKQDDHLARQLFQSAYVGYPQDTLLQTCEACGETVLGAHLQELLEQNPYFDG